MRNLCGAFVFIVLFVWSNHISWIMCHRVKVLLAEKKSYKRRVNEFKQPIPCIVGESCVQVPVDSCGYGCECIPGTPRPGITNLASCTELEDEEEIIEVPYTCAGVPCVQVPEDSCDDGCKCTPRPGITINDLSWPGITNTDLSCTEIVVVVEDEEEEEEEIVEGGNVCYGGACVTEPEDSCNEGCECTLVTPKPGYTNTAFSCTLL